jgi:hypothetical protein
MAADNMALAADTFAQLISQHPCAKPGDLAHILMADGKRRMYIFLTPRIPVINMKIRTANRSFAEVDEHFSRPWLGDGLFDQGQASLRFFLDDCVHLIHERRSFLLSILLNKTTSHWHMPLWFSAFEQVQYSSIRPRKQAAFCATHMINDEL